MAKATNDLISPILQHSVLGWCVSGLPTPKSCTKTRAVTFFLQQGLLETSKAVLVVGWESMGHDTYYEALLRSIRSLPMGGNIKRLLYLRPYWHTRMIMLLTLVGFTHLPSCVLAWAGKEGTPTGQQRRHGPCATPTRVGRGTRHEARACQRAAQPLYFIPQCPEI